VVLEARPLEVLDDPPILDDLAAQGVAEHEQPAASPPVAEEPGAVRDVEAGRREVHVLHQRQRRRVLDADLLRHGVALLRRCALRGGHPHHGFGHRHGRLEVRHRRPAGLERHRQRDRQHEHYRDDGQGWR
jgi:hypothetical protein